MKIVTTMAMALLLSSTSALAFQERPLQETAAQNPQTKTTALSRFSDDDDGSIAQAYGPATFSSPSGASNGFPLPVIHHHR
ncbi:TPA: hypothetical protein PFE21_003358 [Kluyvera ascorbata]|nr:hypothetical protein [Kluyvera ascorbata]